MIYRIFDTTVQSNIPLTGLLSGPEISPEITVDFRGGTMPDRKTFKWLHEWNSPGGTVVMACARKVDHYLLQVPGVADYSVRWKDGLIRVYPHSDSSESAVVQALLDQVIPRLLFHMGRVVMHASAVVLPDGSAIAFIGNTGRGKSTLAASFCLSGARLLTDDCLMLDTGTVAITGIPAYPSLRLWPDSYETLGCEALTANSRELDTGKRAMELKREDCSSDPVRLSALFLLGDPSNAPGEGSIRCEPLRGRDCLMTMIEAAFVLDVVSPDTARRNFELLGQVAQSGTPLYTLDFEQEYNMLPSVRSHLQHFLEQG